MGRYGAGIKIAVAAPAERGKANAAVVAVLAEWLGVREGDVELASGPANPRKVFRIASMDEAALARKLAAL
jgi:uncharacterized protein